MDSNVILVFDREKKKLLMCRRRKPPYQGLLNLVGGKVEPGEEREHAAYRELWGKPQSPGRTSRLITSSILLIHINLTVRRSISWNAMRAC